MVNPPPPSRWQRKPASQSISSVDAVAVSVTNHLSEEHQNESFDRPMPPTTIAAS